MRFFLSLVAASIALPAAFATKGGHNDEWRLSEKYVGRDFLREFEHQAIDDPTHGRVTYVDEWTALKNNLTYANGDTLVIRTDYKTVLSSTDPGRKSVRIRSKKTFRHHVLIADVRHIPQGLGTWPALWEVKEDGWPNFGEVDIIEGVHDQSPNAATLHTGPNCTMPDQREQLGTPTLNDCDVAANYNAGCGVRMPTTNSYGPEFNQNGGGHFVMERTATYVKVWFYPRGTAPAEVARDSRRFSTDDLGIPTAFFPNTQCDIENHFGENNIIINLTLCGDWAGNADIWAAAGGTGTCEDYVNNNPNSFVNAYWDIASIRVFE